MEQGFSSWGLPAPGVSPSRGGGGTRPTGSLGTQRFYMAAPRPPAPCEARQQKPETARPGCELLAVPALTLVVSVGSTQFLDGCVVSWLWEKVLFQWSMS